MKKLMLWRARYAALSSMALVAPLCQAKCETAVSPVEFLALVNQAESRSTQKDWTEASGLWEQVVVANPTEGRFWQRLGEARHATKSFQSAIDAYRKAVALGSGSPANNAYSIAECY